MLRKEEAPGCSVQRKRMRRAARKTSQRLRRILVLIYHHHARFQARFRIIGHLSCRMRPRYAPNVSNVPARPRVAIRQLRRSHWDAPA